MNDPGRHETYAARAPNKCSMCLKALGSIRESMTSGCGIDLVTPGTMHATYTHATCKLAPQAPSPPPKGSQCHREREREREREKEREREGNEGGVGEGKRKGVHPLRPPGCAV